jgi:uncharacterized protein DUF6152
MTRTLPILVAISLLAAVPAQAHHAHSAFLLDQRVTVEGQLEELRYANPHVLLRIRTANGVLYDAEWQAASWLQLHAHVLLTTLRVRDHIIVTGSPSREAESHALVRLTEVRRPRDGWTYQVVPERSGETSGKH